MAEQLVGDVEIDGKLTAVNADGEHALVNAHPGLNGGAGNAMRANVVSVRNLGDRSSSAVRFLSAIDATEFGAVGYQNGVVGFILDGRVYLAACHVGLDGNVVAGPPPGLVLAQQGTYQGVWHNVGRLFWNADWSMHFQTPLEQDFISADADGTLHLLSAVKLSTTLDASAVPANTPTLIPAATTETPTTWVNGAPGANPAGFVKIMAGGSPAYMPYWR